MLEAILDTASSFASSAKKGAQTLALSAALMMNYTPANASTAAEPKSSRPALEECVSTEAPHYIKEYDVRHTDDRVEQTKEIFRVLHATRGAYGSGEASYTLENSAVIFKEKLYGKDVQLILPEYTVRKDGKILYTTCNGSKEISQQELEVVRKDLLMTLKTAVDNAYSDLKGYTDFIVESADKDLKKAGKIKEGEWLVDILDKVIPGYEADASIPGDLPVRYRDALMIPSITKESFVPKKLYLAPFDAWGLCYIDAGIVGYHPQARMIDVIHGKPTVLTHELYHNQRDLQGNPMIRYFDAEQMASLAMLGNDYPLTFLRHGYFKKYRELAKVFYGFDSDKELEGIKKTEMGSTLIFDEKKLRRVSQKIDTLSADMRDVFLTKVGPMFYKDPLYWVSVNKDLADDAAATEILFSAFREPVLLNGFAETYNWLQEWSAVIDESARAAEKAMKDKQPGSGGTTIIIGATPEQQKVLTDLAKKYGFDNEYQMYKMFNTLHEAGLISEDRFSGLSKMLKSEMRWLK